MIGMEQVDQLIGATVVDADGHKVGKVGDAYFTEEGPPRWVTVHTGLFERRESFVPIDDATLDGKVLRIPYRKATVKDAPHIDPEAGLTPDEESELHRYYDLTAAPGSRLRSATGGRESEREVGEDLPADRNIVATPPPPPERPLFVAEGVMLHPDEDDQIRRSQIDFDGEVGRDRV